MSIQPLPADVAAQIKSSSAIISLNGAVLGLLQNSLDAGASKINILVDYSRGNCSLEDNGLGIPPTCFRNDGGLGKLHYTSKYPPGPDCHGKRGEFLAALASLSLLSISSHHRDYRTHNSLTIHNSRVISRHLPAPQEEQVLAFASGSRVTVRDLFGSMPVRVKQRAVEVERVGTSKEFDQLVSSVVAFLLCWPGEVAVVVQDVYARRTVTLTTASVLDLGQGYRGTGSSIVGRTTELIEQASLADGCLKSWVPIGATASGISVRGCASLRPVASKRVQFIALGVQPLINDLQSNLFYDDINRVFEESSFGIVEEAAVDDQGRLVKTGGFTGKELKPKKGVDRWPMFFLQIILDAERPVDVDDVLDGKRWSVALITDLVQVMVYEFLKKHHFRPRSIAAVERLKRPKTTASPVPVPPSTASKRVKTSTDKQIRAGPSSRRNTAIQRSKDRLSERSASPFLAWLQTKSGVPNTPKKSPPYALPSPASKQPSLPTLSRSELLGNPLFDGSGKLVRKPFGDSDVSPFMPGRTPKLPETEILPSSESRSERETIVWTDPTTKLKSLIDPRTGFAVRTSTSTKGRVSPAVTNRKPGKELLRLPRPAIPQTTVFQAVEPPIPQTSWELCCEQVGPAHNFEALAAETSNGPMLSTLEGRISKTALHDAEVVNQVDQKFILIKVYNNQTSDSKRGSTTQDPVLVLVDQHAADERCKVEALLQSYFIPSPSGGPHLVTQTQILDKPLWFQLSEQDGRLLVQFKAYFTHWGIFYDILPEPSPHRGVTAEVSSLPVSIAERCRLEPRLLIDLLRKEIWKPQGTTRNMTPRPVLAGRDGEWVTRFHDCPEGIMEMIHSRACRSAIMFNDPLTREQCVELVRRLADCAFPFQCAHGRPSMVPLVHLGQDSVVGGLEQEGGMAGTLKKWKRKRVDSR